MRILVIVALVLVLLVAFSMTAYTVDRTEFVYVTQFGKPVATHDGLTDGGLHWKWPWPIQSVQRLDRRLQYFDLAETEVLTRAGRSVRDGEGEREQSTIDKTITVVAYLCWRIPDKESVDWFIRRVGTPERARTILGEQIRGQLAAVVGQKQMDDLISVTPSPYAPVGGAVSLVLPGKVEENTRAIEKYLVDSVKERAAKEYGIEIVDIRLRRTSYPLAVRDEIFDRIRSERKKKAEEYRSDGNAQAARIRSDANAKADDIRNQALAEEKRLKEEADVEAIRIRDAAYSKDENFYKFLKKLATLQRALGDNKTVLLLSSQHELFELLKPPADSKGPIKPPVGTEQPMTPPKDGGK